MTNNHAHPGNHTRISGYAAFVSAPTREFARTMTILSTLPAEQRLSIATGVIGHIQSVGDLDDDEELSWLAERLQKQRWKLVFEAANDPSNTEFSIALVAQNWVQAQQKLSPKRSKMVQLLAQESLKLIEAFLRENLPEESQIGDDIEVVVTAIAA